MYNIYLEIHENLECYLDNKHRNMTFLCFTEVTSRFSTNNTVYDGQHALHVTNINLHFPAT